MSGLVSRPRCALRPATLRPRTSRIAITPRYALHNNFMIPLYVTTLFGILRQYSKFAINQRKESEYYSFKSFNLILFAIFRRPNISV